MYDFNSQIIHKCQHFTFSDAKSHYLIKNCVMPLNSLLFINQAMKSHEIIFRGSLYSKTFRLFFKNLNGEFISPMHDIPVKG